MSAPNPPDWRLALLAHAASETGLLAACREPVTAAEAAAQTGLDLRATAIVMRALGGRGLLEATDTERWRLSAAGVAVIDDPPDPASDAAAALLLEGRALVNHARLSDLLRGAAPGDDVSHRGDAAMRRRFMRAMRQVAAPRVPATVAAVGPPRGTGRLLDIGGAPGSYARGFQDAGWQVTVMDLPETLAVGAAELAAAGVATIAGDATVGVPDGPWEVIYLGNLVHLLGEGDAAALIAGCAAALTPTGVLAVQEVLGDRSLQGLDFGLMMLASTAAGDAYPESAYRGWMAAAGLVAAPAQALDGDRHHLIVGRRP